MQRRWRGKKKIRINSKEFNVENGGPGDEILREENLENEKCKKGGKVAKRKVRC